MLNKATSEARDGFVEHLSPTKVAQQSVTRFINIAALNLVALKAVAKHERLFNKPVASSLNKSLRLAPALGVTKLIVVIDMILVTLCCAT